MSTPQVRPPQRFKWARRYLSFEYRWALFFTHRHKRGSAERIEMAGCLLRTMRAAKAREAVRLAAQHARHLAARRAAYAASKQGARHATA